MGSLILKAALAYFEAHPEQVQTLVHSAIDLIVTHVAAQKSAPAVAK